MTVNGKTRVCAIIGDPVEHSLSPVMHNAAFKKLGLNLVYVAFTVTPTELKTAVLGAKSLGSTRIKRDHAPQKRCHEPPRCC